MLAAWRRREIGALAGLIGLVVQLFAGINDALAASGRLDTPGAQPKIVRRERLARWAKKPNG